MRTTRKTKVACRKANYSPFQVNTRFIQRVMDVNGLTDVSLAKMANIGYPTLYKIMNETHIKDLRSRKLDTVGKLAAYMGIPYSDLLYPARPTWTTLEPDDRNGHIRLIERFAETNQVVSISEAGDSHLFPVSLSVELEEQRLAGLELSSDDLFRRRKIFADSIEARNRKRIENRFELFVVFRMSTWQRIFREFPQYVDAVCEELLDRNSNTVAVGLDDESWVFWRDDLTRIVGIRDWRKLTLSGGLAVAAYRERGLKYSHYDGLLHRLYDRFGRLFRTDIDWQPTGLFEFDQNPKQFYREANQRLAEMLTKIARK